MILIVILRWEGSAESVISQTRGGLEELPVTWLVKQTPPQGLDTCMTVVSSSWQHSLSSLWRSPLATGVAAGRGSEQKAKTNQIVYTFDCTHYAVDIKAFTMPGMAFYIIPTRLYSKLKYISAFLVNLVICICWWCCPPGCQGGGDPLNPERDPLHRRGASALPPVLPAGLPTAHQPRAGHLCLVGHTHTHRVYWTHTHTARIHTYCIQTRTKYTQAWDTRAHIHHSCTQTISLFTTHHYGIHRVFIILEHSASGLVQHNLLL